MGQRSNRVGATADASGDSGTWQTHGSAGQGSGVLEEIGEAECMALMAGQRVGRLIVSGSPPLIFPVNYVVDGSAVVLRTAAGSKLDAVRHDALVTFEVDSIDPVSETGWSVVATGTVREEVHLYGGSGRAQPRPWSTGIRAYWLRIEPMTVTGRRLHRPVGDVGGRGYL